MSETYDYVIVGSVRESVFVHTNSFGGCELSFYFVFIQNQRVIAGFYSFVFVTVIRRICIADVVLFPLV